MAQSCTPQGMPVIVSPIRLRTWQCLCNPLVKLDGPNSVGSSTLCSNLATWAPVPGAAGSAP